LLLLTRVPDCQSARSRSTAGPTVAGCLPHRTAHRSPLTSLHSPASHQPAVWPMLCVLRARARPGARQRTYVPSSSGDRWGSSVFGGPTTPGAADRAGRAITGGGIGSLRISVSRSSRRQDLCRCRLRNKLVASSPSVTRDKTRNKFGCRTDHLYEAIVVWQENAAHRKRIFSQTLTKQKEARIDETVVWQVATEVEPSRDLQCVATNRQCHCRVGDQ
jgi:hypothetical protein